FFSYQNTPTQHSFSPWSFHNNRSSAFFYNNGTFYNNGMFSVFYNNRMFSMFFKMWMSMFSSVMHRRKYSTPPCFVCLKTRFLTSDNDNDIINIQKNIYPQ